MSKDESDRLDRMEKSLTRIEGAVMGDESAGHFGLVSRMNNHAKRIKRLEMWVYRISATAAAISGVIILVYKVATDWWPKNK